MPAIFKRYFWGKEAYRTYWYAFLLSFPFSWRMVLIPTAGKGDTFNEYMDISLYVSDFLLLACFICIIKHENIKKSIIARLKMFHVEHITLSLLVIYTVLNFYLASHKLLWIDSLFTIIRVVVIAYIAHYYFTLDRSCSTWNKISILKIFLIGFFMQVTLGLLQYMNNTSLGLHLIGESNLSANMPGVAKIITIEGNQIRAYGTFLHPNIFGGYISLVFIVVYVFYKNNLFHVEQFRQFFKKFHVEQMFLTAIFVFASISLYISYSKSAILGSILVFSLYLFHVEQFRQFFKKFHVEQMFLVVMMVILVLVSVKGNVIQSTQERIDLLLQYRSVHGLNLFGHGLGQGVISIEDRLDLIEHWKLQPVHNIYSIWISNLGIFGSLLIFIYLAKKIKGIVPRGTEALYFAPLLLIGCIGVFDHYPADIYAGNVLLGIALGFVGLSRTQSNLTN